MAPRARFRHFVFTIFLECGEGDPDNSKGGASTGTKFWDPAVQRWDAECLRYVIAGLEKCPRTSRLHWQGYLQLSEAVGYSRVKEVLGCNWAHLEGAKGTPKEARDYCVKAATGETHEDGSKIDFEWGVLQEGGRVKKNDKNSSYRLMLESEDFESAMKLIQELEPREFVVYHEQIKKALLAKFGATDVVPRAMNTFNTSAISKEVMSTKAILLTGDTGLGKTAWALAHFERPMLVRHIDQLKIFNPCKYDGIVFDDMSFAHWPAESCIHLFDLEYASHINCRHSTGVLPAGFPRIFTTNRDFESFISEKCNDAQKRAIERRMYIENVEESLFGNDQ